MREGGMESPPGVVPNFDNPEKLVYNASIVTQALCISIIGLVVAVRVYVRVHVLRSFTLEDWLLVAGFVFAVGYSATALTMNHYGGGINQWEVPKEKLAPFGITVYTTMVLYGPCAFCIKASILVFLARIFAPIRKAVIVLYIILGTLLAYYVPVLFLKAAICRPISKFWMPELPGQCFNQRALILADSVISVISDMVLLVAPLPLTCNLQIQKRKRVKIAAVFSAGGLACICSAIRLVDIVQHGMSPNQTLVFMRINLWGIAEVYIGLITACMPFFPALYKYHFGRLTPTAYHHSTDRSIEMQNSKRGKKRNTIVSRKTSDCGSDENVLITDILESGRLRKPHCSSESVMSTLATDDGGQITKTVKIEQVYS